MSRVAHVATAIPSGGFGVAVVVENEPGYAMDASAGTHASWRDADKIARDRDEAASVSPDDAWRILESSLRASQAAGRRWGPR